MSQSLERALLLLDELGTGPRRLGDLATGLDIHKSTALRLLQVLERHGYVRREGESPVFSLGLRIVELSSLLLERLDARQVARPHLERLASVTGETVHLAVREGSHVVYLDKVESSHPVRMYSRVGLHAPVHCTGVGKVLLAFTDPAIWPHMSLDRYTPQTITLWDDLVASAEEIVRQGWGRDEREHEESIRCIAAPVFDSSESVAAAISVSVPTSRMGVKELRSHVPHLLATASDISAHLGGARQRRHA